MPRLRYLTAGESHGKALTATIEGLPAGLPVSRELLGKELWRRRLGYGRSPRMEFEADELEVLGGVRHGRTLGSPVSVVIQNTEWPKWVDAMDPEPRDDLAEVRESGRGEQLTRPRPGHADLVGALKYDYADVRDALERASARETAARVVVGALARQLLHEVGIRVVSHVVVLGGEAVPDDAPMPNAGDLTAIDEDPVRCFHAAASQRMQDRIDWAVEHNETLGGVIEIIVYGLPPGLGSHVHAERKIDGRLAGAALSVQAMKGVEFGLGFRLGDVPGSQAHDEITWTDEDGYARTSDCAGGIEAGMTTGQPLIMRVVMKPLSSLDRPLKTVHIDTHEEDVAITQRSDRCAVPRAGVVLEHVVAYELADALLEKTGGDTVAEVQRNLQAYLDAVAQR